MPGNSRRQGARKTPRKGPTVGSGGQNKRGLRGKGPTPPAEMRTGHPAAKRQQRRATAAGGGEAGAGKPHANRRPPGRDTARAGRAGGRSGGRTATETVVGRNAVVEALRAGVPASTLYVAARLDSDDRVREVLKLAGDQGLAVLEAPRPELDRLTGGALHQGLALQVPAYRYAEPSELLARAQHGAEQPLLVALDGVTDPRNLGAVMRSAAAFGAHGVVVPERRAAGMTAGAWKASAGAAARVPVARATNLTRTLHDYQQAGLFVVGLDAAGGMSVDDVEVAADPLVLVVGSEGKGLSRLVKASCDVVVRIPMAQDTESLNAGVAAGIALYAISRARRDG